MLSGSASKCIQGLAVTAENYNKAVCLLIERFSDKQQAINVYMNKLFSVRTVQYSNLSQLREFYDYVMVQVRSLESLGVAMESFDSLLLPLLLSKLPGELKLKLAHEAGDDQWQLADLLKLLLAEIKAREKCGYSGDYGNASSRLTVNKPNNHNQSMSTFNNYNNKPVCNRQFLNPAHNSTMSTFIAKSNITSCQLCDKQHVTKYCSTYATIKERSDAARRRSLCYKCLKSGHVATSCNEKCRYCQGPHNIAICTDSRYVLKPFSSPNRETDSEIQISKTLTACSIEESTILLQTARVNI